VASLISDFYPGTTKRFRVAIKFNGAALDISADTVTWTVKRRKTDPDSAAALQVAADVTTEGASGVAVFEVTDEQTAQIAPGRYECDIKWERSNGEEYVVATQTVIVKERVSDAV